MRKLLKRHSRNLHTRMYARWDYINKLCKNNAFQLYKPHLSWLQDKAYLTAKTAWKAGGLPDDRRFFLYNTAGQIKKIPGDTIDIGVRYGTSSYFILNGLADANRPHHLFDSFEGVSAPTSEDGKNTAWKKGDLKTDESITRANLSKFQNCQYYKGWIPDRFNEIEDRRFALMHIDVDLYQPTLESLKFFYDKINPGGVIICDDYGSSSCPGARLAFDQFFADKKEAVIHCTSGQAIVVKI